jgi:hypothetical protein
MTEYATIFDYRTSLGFDVLRGMLPLGASAIGLCVFRFRVANSCSRWCCPLNQRH